MDGSGSVREFTIRYGFEAYPNCSMLEVYPVADVPRAYLARVCECLQSVCQIDHALERIAAIERHLDIGGKRFAAGSPNEHPQDHQNVLFFAPSWKSCHRKFPPMPACIIVDKPLAFAASLSMPRRPASENIWPMSRFSTINWRKALKRAFVNQSY
jgi:hypothetical protein